MFEGSEVEVPGVAGCGVGPDGHPPRFRSRRRRTPRAWRSGSAIVLGGPRQRSGIVDA